VFGKAAVCRLPVVLLAFREFYQAVQLNKYLDFKREVIIHRKGAKYAKF
jgi:hypothetical protein